MSFIISSFVLSLKIGCLTLSLIRYRMKGWSQGTFLLQVLHMNSYKLEILNILCDKYIFGMKNGRSYQFFYYWLRKEFHIMSSENQICLIPLILPELRIRYRTE